MENAFRQIADGEIAAGYRLIVERTDWLNQNGIRQWPRPIPEAIIRQRQADGNFYGYWVDDELMAVVCLLKHSATAWGDLLHGNYLVLASLVSSLAQAGRGHGRSCLLQACEYTRRAGYEKLYLDCVDNAGALPGYYARLGFLPVETQTLPDGRRVVLMAKVLQRP